MRNDDSESGERLDLYELWSLFWNAKWFILLVTSLLTTAGVSYALLATQWWRADVVLVQVDTRNLRSELAQLGGLASLAGINIGGVGADQAPVAVLKSREFAAEFITRNELLPVLFAEKWDVAAGHWKSADPNRQPDIRDGVRYFEKSIRSVTEDRKTGLVTLSILWKNPELAARWANEIVRQVNQKLREQALAESERNIAYLRGEMAATNVAFLQQSIARVLESEMQKMLLARGREEYAFRIIDHAVPPKRREKPQRVILAIFSFMMGGGLSVTIVLLRRVRRTHAVAAAT